ncbi:MuDR family transposase [Melia azedarach]|uniref:MuDR family transposase n=1 Tax=Melia azedarach TaxID=155640 RepID=A0ACC1XWN6_MELAZ|nr:MuDR family transposase [Melia azedarach]
MQQLEVLIPHLTPQAEDVYTPEDYSGQYASDSEEDLPNEGDDDSNERMNDYESGNDSDIAEDDNTDDPPTVRYDRNSGGFEFCLDDKGNMELKQGHTFYTVYDFRAVLKVFAIKHGFRLKRIKNEKTRVTCKCAGDDCEWRIHASPSWDKLSFQIKTFNPIHSCSRICDNWEANSTWIAAQFLHLFRANPNVDIKVIASELLRKYKVTCQPLKLYRARQKALELLGADHKASYTKLDRYGAAVNQTNPGLPVHKMLEEIQRKTMKLIHDRYEEAKKWGDTLPPIVKKRIVKLREKAREMKVIFGEGDLYEVLVDNKESNIVDLNAKTYDCGDWQISGLPCVHAVCCIDTIRANVESYVHYLLTKDAYKRTYKYQINPIPSENRWPLVIVNELEPPEVKKQPGRPKKSRIREADEDPKMKRSCSVRCTLCSQWGHNKRTCKKKGNAKKKTKLAKEKQVVGAFTSAVLT